MMSYHCDGCGAEIRSLNRRVVVGTHDDPDKDQPLHLFDHKRGTGLVKCPTCIMADWLRHCAFILRRV